MQAAEILKLLEKSEEEYCDDLSDFIKGNDSAKDGIDSLTFIRFVVLLEEDKNIEFDDDKLSLECFENARSLINYITLLENKCESVT